jgi:hypothetical protein
MDALTELRHIYLEDFLLTSLFPNFCPQQVGGFIHIILRGLLRLNYDEYIHNAALHNKTAGNTLNCSYNDMFIQMLI